MKLEIEPVPRQNWHKSLAHLLPKPVWDELRREVYSASNYTCVICGVTGVEVHCHEVWEYDDKKRTQTLSGFQCVCKDCHNVKHWGRTVAEVHKGRYTTDYLTQLTNHFCKVNSCSLGAFDYHKVEVGTLLQRRNRKDYKVVFGKFEPDRVVKIWAKRNKETRR